MLLVSRFKAADLRPAIVRQGALYILFTLAGGLAVDLWFRLKVVAEIPGKFVLVTVALLIIGVIGTPKGVYLSRRSLLSLPQGIALLVFWWGDTATFGWFGACIFIALQFYELFHDARKHNADKLRYHRAYTFLIYQAPAGFLVGFSYLLSDSSLVGGWMRLFGACCSLGLFPFHSWIVLYLSNPRRKIVPGILQLTYGAAVLVKVLLPLFFVRPELRDGLLFFASVGALYFAVLLFGEDRLKRMIPLLYLSNLSVLLVMVSSGRGVPVEALTVQISNLLLGTTGLLVLTSLLVVRFGIEGVRSQGGFHHQLPHLGVCFLVCTLSLVGFPGTLGFCSEEILVESLHHLNLHAIIILLAFGLNGYSVFRVFGTVFGGRSRELQAVGGLDLLPRELAAVSLLSVWIVFNGLIPLVLAIIS
jgi:formate hydrogenlyase subunit 3/multisubunit Na+/H+ antiporter MnhD subunit